ncbi:hypothetical protein R9X52_18420 [Klebsiella pneumoniae]|uniref:hypothetical protein n=1 Tax=Klebsiella TaxID=570 RepID=UPI0029C4E853|nr:MULTISPECIES: hypothetical protein [Klebsiella]MDX6134277.1 hypothetical protein [Klebsiella sp. CN_Kp094]MDX6855184.1 hypothetical protein [Klebsiella pneumoniae]
MQLEIMAGEKLNITVECYNNMHRELLNDSNRYNQVFIDRMNEVIKNGVEITGAEFLVNSLFHKKETKPSKYTDRDALLLNMKNSLHLFEDDLEISHGSLRVQADSKPEAAIIMKRVGEAIGLSVVSRIIGVTEADWSVIPELDVKAFDFGYAVTDKGVVQVETKGSCALDITGNNQNIYNHAANIKKKKEVMSNDKNHPYPGDYNYGTIAFSQIGGKDNVKCYLLDPPSGKSEINIPESRLAKKLGFYYEVLNFISPKSTLIPLLWDRVIDLGNERVKIDTVEPLPYFNTKSHHYEIFFLNKTSFSLEEYKVSGDWFHYKDNYVVFIGVDISLLENIIDQKIDELFTNRYNVISQKITVSLNVITKYQRQQFEKLKKTSMEYSDKTFSLKARGYVTVLSSGILVGVLKVITKQ